MFRINSKRYVNMSTMLFGEIAMANLQNKAENKKHPSFDGTYGNDEMGNWLRTVPVRYLSVQRLLRQG